MISRKQVFSCVQMHALESLPDCTHNKQRNRIAYLGLAVTALLTGLTRTTRRFPLGMAVPVLAFSALLGCGGGGQSGGQAGGGGATPGTPAAPAPPAPSATIAYIAPDATVPGSFSVWLANPDGSGKEPVPAKLVALSNPKWSRDGHLITATGTAPGGSIPDVFVFDPSGGNLAQISHLQTDAPVTASSAQAFSAFSPAGDQVAVAAVLQETSPTPGNMFDVLLVYSRKNPSSSPIIVGGAAQDQDQGFGVDWSPNASLLAVPISAGVICGSLPQVGTAIWSVPPVANAFGQGLGKQITQPLTCADPTISYQDLLPVFSPDGTQIAFVRWIQPLSGPTIASSIRIINVDGTNEREVVNLAGEQTLAVSWSHDSRKLVFDQNPVVGGIPDTNSSTLWTINVDGNGLSQIPLQPPAQTPSWRQ